MSASPSIGVIRAQIRAIRDKSHQSKVFGILTPRPWTGPLSDGTGPDEIAIYPCDSPLQMRLALQDAATREADSVLLTPLDPAKVSDDILVRLATRKFHPINRWESLRALFKARQLDPRITRHGFLADLLLEHAGLNDVAPVAGGLLDADTVWGILLPERLGLSNPHPDVVELLRCTAEAGMAGRWKACSAEFRDAATEWISETAGDVAKAILGCLAGEHGKYALAIGLVMEVVYHPSVGSDLDKAVGRLEAYVGQTNLSPQLAGRWRDAAVIATGQLSREVRRYCLDRADDILESTGAKDHAWRSDTLEIGFEQRISRLGRALIAHVDARATTISEELQHICDSLWQHRLGRDGGRRMDRVAMAIRLARWLAEQSTAPSDKASSLSALARSYAADGGYVDWARQVLRGGEANKDLARAFARLVERVTEIREAENLCFAKALVEQQASGDVGSGLIPVERIIEQVVMPAVQQAPVLILLVDGMSWSVFRELATDIAAHDWIDLGMGSDPRRLIGLAALPSVTEVCRASFWCGALRRGQAPVEIQGFATHPQLVAASQAGFPPKLFHKASLEAEDDSSLAGEIRKALENRKQRVVGIVINAVDDLLDKGDQIDVVWSMQQIRVLEPILAEARAAGRIVIMLSDHGHVLDRQTEYCEATDGLRWRQPGKAVAKGEVEAASSRVLMPDGGRVVVPWSERFRYGAKKNGYHGGATPQEMLIPIGIFWPESQAPEGFGELPAEFPAWWTEPTVSRMIPYVGAPGKKQRKPKVKQLDLFVPAPEPPAKPEKEAPWISALFQSDVFAEQKQRVAVRVPISDEKVHQLLTALASRGGSMTTTALAGAMSVPEHRLPGFLSLMQRLLNVEGYAILDRQDAANTVSLNVSLLKKQFELEG